MTNTSTYTGPFASLAEHQRQAARDYCAEQHHPLCNLPDCNPT